MIVIFSESLGKLFYITIVINLYLTLGHTVIILAMKNSGLKDSFVRYVESLVCL